MYPNRTLKTELKVILALPGLTAGMDKSLAHLNTRLYGFAFDENSSE